MTDLPPSIGIIGGTGKLGMGLAARWSRAGIDILLGSRDAAKSAAAAAVLKAATNGVVHGLTNREAAAQAALVVLTVPFSVHGEVLREIRPAVTGKIVVDTTVPLLPPAITSVHLPPEGSAARQARLILGSDVRVVSTLHTVAAARLKGTAQQLDSDVLVFGDDATARERPLP